MRVGIFGGTFDPIHSGHLVIAEAVKDQLNLAEIIFVPAGQPWLKADWPISPAQHRRAMLRLALAGKPYFKISDAELERAGPSYTVDTVEELRRKMGEDAELFFILGWDSLATLPRWHDASRLIRLCTLVAVHRPGYPRPDLKPMAKSVPGVSRRVIFMTEPCVDISATDIRVRVRQGLPLTDLVPEAVARYSKENGLYRD
jgi:nicotinate-nucleotide adenylyltransferase